MHSSPVENQNKLIEDLQRAHRELAIMYEVSNAMRATLDLRHILYIILTGVTAHKGLGFNRAILFLVNNLTRCLEPQMAIGPDSFEHAQKIWGYISDSSQNLDDLIQKEKLDQDIGQGSLFQSVKQLKIPLSVTKDNLLMTACINGVPTHIPQDQIAQYANDPLLQVFKTNELVQTCLPNMNFSIEGGGVSVGASDQ